MLIEASASKHCESTSKVHLAEYDGAGVVVGTMVVVGGNVSTSEGAGESFVGWQAQFLATALKAAEHVFGDSSFSSAQVCRTPHDTFNPMIETKASRSVTFAEGSPQRRQSSLCVGELVVVGEPVLVGGKVTAVYDGVGVCNGVVDGVSSAVRPIGSIVVLIKEVRCIDGDEVGALSGSKTTE